MKDLILQRASVLFAEVGFEATTTRAISDACDIDQSELFRIFSSKTEIMNDLLKADLDQALAVAERELQGDGTAGERLYRYLLADLELSARSPFNLAGVTRPSIRRELSFAGARARHQRLFDARVELIREGMASGEFVSGDPVAAGRVVEWSIAGFIGQLAGSDKSDVAEELRQVADFCLRSLLRDPEDLTSIKESVLEDGIE